MTLPRPDAREQAAVFFAGSPLGLAAYEWVQSILDGLGPCELRVSRTQVGWARRRGFAFIWLPGRWLSSPSAEVVLAIAAERRIQSPRWKQVVEGRPGLFMHHLELQSVADIDEEVRGWLTDAFDAAAPRDQAADEA